MIVTCADMPLLYPWVVRFREDFLLKIVCFFNGEHGLLEQNV